MVLPSRRILVILVSHQAYMLLSTYWRRKPVLSFTILKSQRNKFVVIFQTVRASSRHQILIVTWLYAKTHTRLQKILMLLLCAQNGMSLLVLITRGYIVSWRNQLLYLMGASYSSTRNLRRLVSKLMSLGRNCCVQDHARNLQVCLCVLGQYWIF